MLTTPDYREAKINKRNGDLSKRWYLEFYAIEKETEFLKRVVMYCPAKYRDEKQRLRWLREKQLLVNAKLSEGMKLEYTNQAPVKKEKMLTYGIREFHSYKSKNHRKKGVQSFYSVIKKLLEYLEVKKYQYINVHEFTQQMAYESMNYIENLPQVKSASTYNNHLIHLKGLFNNFIEQDLIKVNPYRAIKRKQVEESLNTPFSDLEKKQILNEAENKPLAFFLKVMYYTCIRPKELRNLRIMHIMPDQIMIPGTISKNKKNNHVLITPGLKTLFAEMNIYDYPKTYYIFSKNGMPSENKLPENYMYEEHKKILHKLNLKGYSLYSWKDTAACDFYNSTKDIEFVSRHLRHSSIDMTKKYLKSLGVLTDKSNLENSPKL